MKKLKTTIELDELMRPQSTGSPLLADLLTAKLELIGWRNAEQSTHN
jgi:hypothetical protein